MEVQVDENTLSVPNEEEMEGETGGILVSDLSAEDLALLEEIAKRKAKEDANKLQQELDEIAAEIQGDFLGRVQRRATKDSQMLRAAKLYYGNAACNYGVETQDRPFRSTNQQNPPQFNIVKTKTTIALAQAISAQFSGGEKNWDILASKDPKGPDGQPADLHAVMLAADKMENVIEDQLADCDYGINIRKAMKDRIILGTGVLKGPINALNHVKRYRSLKGSDGKTVNKAVLEALNRPSIVHVSPWFWYPDDSVLDVRDCEDSIEVHLMSKSKLAALANSPDSGFSDFSSTIFEVLKTSAPEHQVTQNYIQFTSLSQHGVAYKDKYVVLERHGPISRSLLDKLSITPTYESPEDIYFGEIWCVNDRVIRVQLSAVDGCFEIPYAVAVWEPDPGHLFGIGLPIFLGDQQNVINKTYEMTLDNASNSSGPQMILNKELIEPATPEDWEFRPGKVWFYTDFADGDVRKAVEFFETPNATAELINLINLARGFAEEESEIPLMAAGLAPAQVVDSATGAQIQQQSSTIASDLKNEQWDDCITKRTIRWMHDWNWEYNPDESIKGDFDIDVRTSSEYKNKLLQIKDMEKLSVEASQNPDLATILNMPEVQRARISMMTLPSGNLVRTDEEIAKIQEEKANQPNPEMMKMQVDMAKIEVEKDKLALEQEKLRQEMTIRYEEAKMVHKAQMAAVYARTQESQAQVMAEELKRQTAMYQLAQKDEVDRAKIFADLKKADIQDQREKFLAGVDHANQLREYLLQEEEIKLAKKNGGGALSTV